MRGPRRDIVAAGALAAAVIVVAAGSSYRVRARVRALRQSLLWLTLIPVLRRRAARRTLRPSGVTIVTVNWNSSRFLQVLLELVPRRSPPGVEIVVVDNCSWDGFVPLVDAHPEARLVRLPLNLGHELALDIGFLLARTEYVVSLDVDAFPLHDGWLDELLAPLENGKQVSGARLHREYVHPCCLAMRLSRFVERKHSFRSHYQPRRPGHDASGDVGEEISAAERGGLAFFDRTEQRGPGDLGMVFGGLVYHNFYSTRFAATAAETLDVHVGRSDPAAAWDEAVMRFA